MNQLHKIHILLLSIILTSCSYSPPALETLPLIVNEDPMSTFLTYSGNYMVSNEDSDPSFGSKLNLSALIGHNLKYVSLGIGFSNFNGLAFVSLNIPKYYSISPYVVREGNGLITGGVKNILYPFPGFGLSTSVYKQTEYAPTEPCGNFAAVCGAQKRDAYWFLNYGVTFNGFNHNKGGGITLGIQQNLKINDSRFYIQLQISTVFSKPIEIIE